MRKFDVRRGCNPAQVNLQGGRITLGTYAKNKRGSAHLVYLYTPGGHMEVTVQTGELREWCQTILDALKERT